MPKIMFSGNAWRCKVLWQKVLLPSDCFYVCSAAIKIRILVFFLPATIIIIGRNGNKKDSLSWQLLLCSSALENFLSLKTRFHARKCKYKGGLVDVGTKCIRARIGPPNFYNCIHYLKKKPNILSIWKTLVDFWAGNYILYFWEIAIKIPWNLLFFAQKNTLHILQN